MVLASRNICLYQCHLRPGAGKGGGRTYPRCPHPAHRSTHASTENTRLTRLPGHTRPQSVYTLSTPPLARPFQKLREDGKDIKTDATHCCLLSQSPATAAYLRSSCSRLSPPFFCSELSVGRNSLRVFACLRTIIVESLEPSYPFYSFRS